MFEEVNEYQKYQFLQAIICGDLESVKNIYLQNNTFKESSFLQLGGYFDNKNGKIYRKIQECYYLCVAVRKNHVDIVNWLLMQKCNSQRISSIFFSETPLHIAIQKDSEELVAILLKHEANLHDENFIGNKPIHVACEFENPRIVKMLLAKDSSCVNTVNKFLSTPLHVAVEKGNLEIIKILIDCKADVNLRTMKPKFKGFTPLHIAIIKNNCEIVNYLLQNKARVHAIINCINEKERNLYGYNSLQLAFEIKNVDIILKLLYFGANLCSNIGMSSLITAIENKDFELVKSIVDFHGDSEFKTEDGKTVLHLLIENNWPDMISRFVNSSIINIQNNVGETALHLAIEMGDEDVVEKLLQFNPDVNIKTERGITPLHIACEFSAELVQLLLDKGADINCLSGNNETPLFIAVKVEDFEIVSTLLKFQPNFQDFNNQLAFSKAIDLYIKFMKKSLLEIINEFIKYYCPLPKNGHNYANLLFMLSLDNGFNTAELLLRNGIDTNASVTVTSAKSNLLLHSLVFVENYDMISLLIKYNCDINFLDSCGKTALCYAIEKNSISIIDLLLANGSIIKNATELFLYAAKKVNYDLVKLLLKYNVDINCSDTYGTSALHFAVWNQDFKFANFLLNKGGNNICSIKTKKFFEIDIKQGDSYDTYLKKQIFTSPLHIAVSKRNQKLVELLLDFNINVHFRDGNGRTSLHIATAIKYRQMEQIIETLLHSGADVNAIDDFQKLPIYYVTTRTCVCSIGFQNQYEFFTPCSCNDEFNFEEIMNIFIKHISILSVMHKYIHKSNLEIIGNYSSTEKYYTTCILELFKLKERKFYDNVTFFELLIKKSNALAAYGRNKNLISAFKSSNYKEIFPIYGNILERQLNLAKQRSFFLESATNTVHNLLKFPLPCVVTEKIFDYLHIKDLSSVINAYEAPVCKTDRIEVSTKKMRLSNGEPHHVKHSFYIPN